MDTSYGLCCFVINDVKFPFFKKVLKGLSISDIRLNKFRLRREEFSRPCGEVINDGYFMAERQKLVDQMRTYKSGTAGY